MQKIKAGIDDRGDNPLPTIESPGLFGIDRVQTPLQAKMSIVRG